jgi:hypothetical protein
MLTKFFSKAAGKQKACSTIAVPGRIYFARFRRLDIPRGEEVLCYFFFPFIISFILWVEGGVIPETRK